MKFLAFLFLILLLAVGATAYVAYLPYGPSSEVFVDIPVGTGSRSMARMLQDAGVIRSRYAFEAVRELKGGTLKAGEYRFDRATTVLNVYDRLMRGDVYTVPVTIPEGYNLWDIANAVQTAKLGTSEDFLRAAQSETKLIKQWNPAATSLEGYLFPDTYLFNRHTTPEKMLEAMVKRFGVAMHTLNVSPGDGVAQLVTMASLVEKEVSQDSERPMVAGVFENRLRAGMPLATDPTVIYAALKDGTWRGTIYQSDLHSNSPYNTYVHTGLPPGPICSPGMAALRAAMHPLKTQNMYFVADAAGHTNFSETLKEHAEQVQKYRDAVR